MIGHAHITVDTLRNPMANTTLNTRSKASPVLKQDNLLLILQSRFDRIKEKTTKTTVDSLALTFDTHIINNNIRHLKSTITLFELNKMITALQSIEITLKRRSRRTKEDIRVMEAPQNQGEVTRIITRSRISLLEGRIMFLINNDKAKI